MIVDAKPKKAKLQTHGITDDIVNYSSYSCVGTCLLNDENGNKIKKLEVDYGSVAPRIEEIFWLWMNGNGATPVSWVGLVSLYKLQRLRFFLQDISSGNEHVFKFQGSSKPSSYCTFLKKTFVLTPISQCPSLFYSFFPQTVSLWNSLSSNVVTSTSIASFKRQLSIVTDCIYCSFWGTCTL